jgi:NADP-dependent 3-hydroxy acid dehydrogenase YdfG
VSNITDKVVVITGASSGIGKVPRSFSHNKEPELY